MKRLKSIFIILTTLSIILIFSVTLFLNNRNKKNEINIAASDDSSGLLVDYLMNRKTNLNLNIKKELKSHKVVDCCSNTLSMGLSSKDLDIALVCPYSANVLVNKDKSFEILGPCILNSNTFLLNSKEIKSVGISDGRDYEKAEVYKKFGENIKIIPMINTSLPYSLEKGNVQGILIDAIKGLLLKNKNYEVVSLENKPTYVLVVSKKFKEDKRYKLFLKQFNESLKELNNPNVLNNAINTFKHIDLSRKELEIWKKLKIKFVPIIVKEN